MTASAKLAVTLKRPSCVNLETSRILSIHHRDANDPMTAGANYIHRKVFTFSLAAYRRWCQHWRKKSLNRNQFSPPSICKDLEREIADMTRWNVLSSASPKIGIVRGTMTNQTKDARFELFLIRNRLLQKHVCPGRYL